jgi:hypothetical protein
MEHKDYPIDLLDEDGRVVAHKPRGDVNKRKDIYNGVQVLIITPRSELVLSNIPERDDLPNIYTRRLGPTVGTIRRRGETAMQAARRALKRELLMAAPKLELMGDDMLRLADGRREQITAYYAVAEPPTEFSTVDIESLQVMGWARFKVVMRANPDHFAPTLRAAWERWGERLPLE